MFNICFYTAYMLFLHNPYIKRPCLAASAANHVEKGHRGTDTYSLCNFNFNVILYKKRFK